MYLCINFNTMKSFKTLSFAISALALMTAISSCCSQSDPYSYEIKDGTIIYNTPARPADQQSMLGFAAAPLETV